MFVMYCMFLSGVDFDIWKIDELVVLINVKCLVDGWIFFIIVLIFYGGYVLMDILGIFLFEFFFRLNVVVGLFIVLEEIV